MRTRVSLTVVVGVLALARLAAQRPSYPIVAEIHVDQECRVLLGAEDKKLRFKKDPVICHLESVQRSEHVEEMLVGDELRRSRVTVGEQEYVLQNISADPVIFVVEQPVAKGWMVDSDPQPSEMAVAGTGSVARFQVHAQSGEIVRLHVGERFTKPLRSKFIRASASSGRN